jgi:glycosyltransferase involved in cell wall biosynthesis
VTRVLHVLPHPGGGGETYVDLLRGLDGYVHERLYLSQTRSPLRAAPAIAAALVRAARPRVDIVHGHGDVAGVLAAPVVRGRPFVISSHGLHMLRRARGPARTVFLACLSRALAGAVTICESRAERDELAAVRPNARLVVVPNGIVPAPPGPPESLRAELGLAAGEVLGVFAGQLEERKEPLLAIAAAERARAAGAPFVLAVAGAGPQEAAVDARAGAAVRPLGYRRDLGAILAAAEVYVAPSRREGVSYALLEAMGSGLVPVVADGPGSPEVVGDAGLVVAAGDEEALARALVRLCAEPELRRALGRAARRRVVDHYSLEGFLRETRAAYEQALTGPGPGAGAGRA